MKNKIKSSFVNLRMKAEEMLRGKPPKSASQLSEADILKLVHELEVQQIELELQQEELIWAEDQTKETAAKVAIEKFAEFYDSAPLGYFTLSQQGEIKALNLRGARILGKTRSFLKDSQFGSFISDDSKSIFKLFLNKIFSGKTKETCMVTVLTNCNLPMYFNLKGIVSKDGEHCYITAIDITRSKLTEDELRENNSRLELAMRSANMAWWNMDITNGKVTFEKRKAEMLGFPPEKFASYKDFMDLVHPDDTDFVMNAMRDHLDGSTDKYEVEYRILTASGAYRWFYDTGSVANRDREGKPLNVIGLVMDISIRKQTDEKLAASEARLHTLLQTIPDLIWLKDSDGVYLSCNKMFGRFFGARETDIIGKTDYDFVDRELGDFFREHDRKAMAAGKPTSNEEWITFADDGHRVFLETIKMPVYDSKNILIGVLGIGRDITERKETEKALHESLERYKNLTGISPVGIFHTDGNGLTTFVNPAWCQITGLSFDEALGDNWLNAVHPDDKEKLLKGWKEASMSQKIAISDYRFVRPDGSIAWVMGQAIPEINAEGKAIGYIGTITDITERKKAEDVIAGSNFFLQTLLDTIPAPIFYKDINGRYIGCNKAFELFFGKTSLEIAGKTVFEIAPGELAQFYYTKDMELFGQQGVQEYDSQLIDKHGIIRDVVFHMASIMDANGRVSGLIGVILDITERKKMVEDLMQAKEKAEESDRLKSAFLANMSHEIRTPMNGILGFAGLLKESNLSGEEQQEYINIIDKSGKRMLNIINDIVSISKVESGQMEISITETNINEQIEYIYSFFKLEAEQKGIRLVYHNSLPVKEAILKTDREKIYAILTNLVKNALKFTRSGVIEFGYQLKPAKPKIPGEPVEMEFYVKDTGVGIRSEQVEFIFERFRQGSESLNRAYEGAGLGLAISKAYVEMLGGKIRVESDFGKGSVFYFTIPYNGVQEEKMGSENVIPVVEPINHENPAGPRLKILIAEDDEISALLLSKEVKSYAKQFLYARNGVEAVRLCRDNPDIDLVLMDIKMPVMDGYEATRQIREFNNNMIIFAQTAFALVGDREKSTAAGCNEYVTKPIKRALLTSLLKKYF